MKKILCIIIAALMVLTACSKKEEVKPVEEAKAPVETSQPKEEEKVEEEVVPEVITSKYSGREIREDQVGQRPFMVMIDNHQGARPQANISKASIVWEMRVEGEFTRYLALFERNEKGNDFLVGPIRSARPNFVTIANQYGGIYGHHGGSTDGEKLIKTLGVNNLSGMTLEGRLFFRYKDTGKRAPHNSYLNLDKAFKYAKDLGWSMKDKGEGFTFNKEFTDLAEGKSAKDFYINYRGKLNNIAFKYDEKSKAYERYREGKLQVDELTSTPVMPVNVIIQYADSYAYDNKGHMAFKSTGTGKGYYVTGGKYIEIKWDKKDDHTTPTKFMTMDGKELVLNPGLTWIQVIDSKMDPNFK